ncbi:hypothetical protein KC19_6G010700 [Ceratodon purpureus]|uniref:Uncharacterized protein n=1 Tax=Ceratodon purpureus TaxID=3225 RepID=A0A8T0HAK1_CERPU|nr:hypothetical protein KC19_6G010700 [Ceratodon purpureus]
MMLQGQGILTHHVGLGEAEMENFDHNLSSMEKVAAAVAPTDCEQRLQRSCAHAKTGSSLDDLNTALIQAANEGNHLILNLLIDAGATNLVGAMTCAGWSGHIHVVDALIKRTRPVAFGAAFVGALVGLQKDMIDYVVHVADKDGLDKCLLMGAARIWSCSTLEEVTFLLYAIQSLVDAGAKSFQRAMQVSCGDAVIEYWNGDIFMDKAKILQRLVVLGSSHLTPDFFGRILLMICVTFLCKLLKCQEKVCRGSAGSAKRYCKSGENLRCATVVQDMINVLSVVCKNGAADLISSRLLDIADGSLDDVRRLLNISDSSFETCSTEWPLKMLKFLLIDCGIKDLSVTVTTLPAFQAARLNVLLPVVKCFLELQCFEAAYVYLDMSITFCQMEAIRYLLSVIPQPVDTTSLVQAVRAAASNTRGPPRGPQGVLCALHSNFLFNEGLTMAEAAVLAELPETDQSVRMSLRSEWSQQAFEAGVQAGQRHFLNWMLVKKRTSSPLRIGELPLELQVAIGYLPLYKDCSFTPGSLLSQRQRGELVAALRQLYQGSRKLTESVLLNADKRMLLCLLAARLPAWCCISELKHCGLC